MHSAITRNLLPIGALLQNRAVSGTAGGTFRRRILILRAAAVPDIGPQDPLTHLGFSGLPVEIR